MEMKVRDDQILRTNHKPDLSRPITIFHTINNKVFVIFAFHTYVNWLFNASYKCSRLWVNTVNLTCTPKSNVKFNFEFYYYMIA